MSRRVFEILRQFAPSVEQYSVDEAFMSLSNLGIKSYSSWAAEVQERVVRWTGIPVTVGIGPTKTLAKASTELSKNRSSPPVKVRPLSEDLKELSVDEVWGVGRRLAPRLRQYSINSAYDLCSLDENWARQFAGITFVRTVKEMQGIDCYGSKITFNEPSKKTLLVSRSFGQVIHAQNQLESAIASFAARAAHRLRRASRVADRITVFIQTGINAKKPYSGKLSAPLPYSSDDTGLIISQAIKLLDRVYDPGFGYKRAGVFLSDLRDKTSQQLSLTDQAAPDTMSRQDRLMKTLDHLGRQWGEHAVRYGVEGSGEKWRSKRKRVNPAYTTRWNDLPVVKI